ncbi:MAG: (d)CMP kinase [Chitinophagales bacterium]|nr:(d)CMP kinase [Chitinophagales bacterium]
MKKIIIAIDGYSSCGKSTLAKALAAALQYTYIDSGAMYRAVTLYFLQKNIKVENMEQVTMALKEIEIRFDHNNHTLLNGENVEELIRQMHVSNYVSEVAAVTEVRRALVAQQQAMGIHKGIVMDGRDIGTVVFPDAALKLFLTASLEVRAERRYMELLSKGQNTDLEAVKANLQHRDHIDSNRADSPLMQATDAIVIDNTNISREEQFELAMNLAQKAIAEA